MRSGLSCALHACIKIEKCSGPSNMTIGLGSGASTSTDGAAARMAWTRSTDPARPAA